MREITSFIMISAFVAVMTMGLSGCTIIFQKGRRQDVEKINKLKTEFVKLQDELSELERAKAELENRLRQEINNKEVSVDLKDRGLVITFVAEVLFDSGKAKLRNAALARLDKVAQVLKTTVSDLNVGIEGHTDNVPIRRSGWKSNWELSSARALSVLHYLIEDEGLNPGRLSSTGYGEYRPVASNDTPQGRQKNRRVEIVILPPVQKEAGAVPAGHPQTENLK